MIQIRNVPDDLHRRLKSRAALAGMSLSDFLLKEIEKVAQRPSLDELRERLARRSTAELDPPAHQVIREDRDNR
jgi:plasmid stability protein